MCKKDVKRKDIEDSRGPPPTPTPKKPKADPEDELPVGFTPAAAIKPQEIRDVKEEPAAAEAKPEPSDEAKPQPKMPESPKPALNEPEQPPVFLHIGGPFRHTIGRSKPRKAMKCERCRCGGYNKGVREGSCRGCGHTNSVFKEYGGPLDYGY